MAIKYKWLAERLELLILKNIQAGIHKLPTEQQLCTRYHVSRQTVRMAMAILEEKGLIVRKQGSGAYITGRSQKPLGNVCLLYTSGCRQSPESAPPAAGSPAPNPPRIRISP